MGISAKKRGNPYNSWNKIKHNNSWNSLTLANWFYLATWKYSCVDFSFKLVIFSDFWGELVQSLLSWGMLLSLAADQLQLPALPVMFITSVPPAAVQLCFSLSCASIILVFPTLETHQLKEKRKETVLVVEPLTVLQYCNEKGISTGAVLCAVLKCFWAILNIFIFAVKYIGRELALRWD